MKSLFRLINRIVEKAKIESLPSFPNVHKTASIARDVTVMSPEFLFMGEKTRLHAGAIIMNGSTGKFIMKKWSGAAVGLTAICGNHLCVVGKPYCEVTEKLKSELDKNHEFSGDIIIEEDVWIGANVTLLQGITIGRGAIVGAGSVVRTNVPPYATITGNPAKIVAFRFSPSEILQHELLLYPENERIPEAILKKNYENSFISKVKEIKTYTKVSL